MEKLKVLDNFGKLNNFFFKMLVENKQNKKDTPVMKDLINILSPGRVNIIGEHTDYNLGLSITTAINKYNFITGCKNNTDIVEVFSKYLNDSNKFSISDINFDKDSNWVNYIKGVLKEYIQHGYKIGGFNLAIDSSLPIGAGMSSSASLEVGVARLIEELFNLKVDKKDTVQYCNNAENDFVGVNVGLMDQFSVAFGKESHVIYLNFKDLSYEYIPFDLEDKMPERLFKRVKHVVTENNRVLLSKEYLLKGDIEKLGKVLFESHDSLRYDYEVSTEKLDYLVYEMSKIKGVYGGRLMGAGFGGSIISIVKKSEIDNITNIIGDKFLKKFNISPDFIDCLFSDGT